MLTGSEALADFENVQELLAIMLPFLFAFLAITFFIGIAIYIYTSFAFMAIGKKVKLKTPGLAWIPGVGPMIIAFQSAKMPWWPWLLLSSILIMWIPIFGWIVGGAALLLFSVYSYIWTWKMFEAVKKPGWWALAPLVSVFSFIPLIGIIFSVAGSIGFLVLLGIAAWSKEDIIEQIKKPKKVAKK